MKCKHKNTHYEDWPDGGTIEVCENCGMSRHHWEWDNSGWTMIKDIEKARKEVQAGIDQINKGWDETENDPIEDIKAGFDALHKINQQPNKVIYIGKILSRFLRKYYAKKEISNNS